MTSSRTTRGRWATGALLCALACGGDDEGGEPRFPTRDWSGTYALRVVESSTDCLGAEAPPPLGDLALEVEQTVDNDAIVRIGPFVSLGGRFDGDELEAHGAITQPLSLPDSLLARAAEADSLETISYRLEARFVGDTLRGRYRIRAPDLNALARDTGERRCVYEYEVRGATFSRGGAPGLQSEGGPPGGPR